MSKYIPDVVDASTIAWDLFTASLDVDVLELERVSRLSNREALVSEVMSERFGTRKHRWMVFGHERHAEGFRASVERVRLPPVFEDWQLAVAMRALAGQDSAVSGLVRAAEPNTRLSTEWTSTSEKRKEAA